MEIKKFFVSWQDVEKYVEAVKQKCVEKNWTPSGVYGVPRGGLVLAVMLSYSMKIPLLMAPAQNCIIIDDIADSGRTLSHFTLNDTQSNTFFITTMYYHKRSIVKPDFYMFEKKDQWIEFPFAPHDEV